MLVNANAKINLGLHVLSKRQDGFHDLESVFLPLDWIDEIEILPSEITKFSANGLIVPPTLKGNLCMQAYQLLKRKYNLPPLHIKLNKQMPIGAGLGGGSSDAAFVLKALNELFQLNISLQKLEEYAAELGSDCVFFIQNKAAMVKGRGELIEVNERFDVLKNHFILIVKPAIFINSKEAFQNINSQLPKNGIEEIILQPIENWKNQLKNDFEATIFPKYPILEKIKVKMYENGAIYASMSGSGSCIYGIFNEVIPCPSFFRQFKFKWARTL